MENLKILLIYDNAGVIISQSMGTVREPVGLPFLWIDKIPDGKYIVSVDISATPNVPVYNDIAKSQDQILKEQIEELKSIVQPTVDVDSLTLIELKKYKKNDMNNTCQNVIKTGIDVSLSIGTEHFNLSEHDQINLFGKQLQLASGAEQIEYHEDTNPVSLCKYYAAADMQKVINEAMFYVSYNTTYCNSLKVWIDSCTEKREVKDISYGIDIPELYQSEVLKNYIAKISANN